ncbi:electron transport complex subunit RsxC [Psychrobium sp. nBUS_13]|uniref:electron transport complex subunit RsxC n=1 Tax=Psychrobium sp. nBUS_13 TaxID=3395319 RepID=UPI003EB78B40
MSSIFELIDQGQLGQFHGGIHPPSRKDRTSQQPITDMPRVEKYALPLAQHTGQAALCAVKIGDDVKKGQIIGHSDGFISANVLAPVAGVVVDVSQYPASHPSGLNTETVLIKATDAKLESWPKLSLEDDNQTITQRIKESGITGLGGASFPTAVKLSPRKSIDLLLINGAECEPYITADDALMRANSEQIVAGIVVMDKLLSPQRVVVAIEDNKPEAITAMENATEKYEHIIVTAIPTLYPAGGEKQLIEVITGHQVPSGKIPADIGVVVQNIATSHAIADVVFHGKPLLSRVVTVTGDLVERPGNYRVHLGTPIIDLLNFCGFKPVHQQKIIMGGPMMGFALQNLDAPVVKATNCIIAASANELPDAPSEQNCIRCGDCEQVCPAQLLPQQLQWFAKDKDHEKLQQHNLFDCIECGACAYICPSHIPLVQYYRVAKADIRETHQEQLQAQRAKERYEQRQARLDREKQEREERNRLANERRKAAMKQNNDGDAIAAALARVKAKKAGDAAPGADAPKSPQNDRVAAAIARAKAKKSAQQGDSAPQEKPITQSANPDKARVSEAIARAKAKKAAKAAQSDNNTVTSDTQQSPADTSDDKKARIAAAVAKAKAKKAASEEVSNADSDTPPPASNPSDDKKARIAAAVAKAKAKKAASETANNADIETPPAASPSDDKKARIAAAVAKAKAKKAASEAANNADIETPPAASPSDDKKARIAAAVAKAKAKKAASEAANNADNAETQVPIEETVVEEQASSSADSDTPPAASPSDDKKARIAAAVAKAKAKKAASEAATKTDADNAERTLDVAPLEQNIEPQVQEQTDDPAAAKKARVAAAVAKAKAKKAARDSQTNDK